MSSVNLNSIRSGFELVEEINEIMGIWEIWIKDCPVKLKIKVVKSSHPEVPYQGVANYLIQGPDQAGPYRSLQFQPTVQKALEDALKGFLAFYKSDKIEETKFKLDDDWL